MKLMYSLFIILLYLVLCLASAYAQIGVDPVRQEVKGKRGEHLGGTYTVYNVGKEPIDITVVREEWFVFPENKDLSVRSWLKIAPSSFSLEGGGHKVVRYRVNVPKEAVGELVSMIYFSYKEPSSPILTTKFGVSLYVQVDGTEVFKNKILSFNIHKVVVSGKESYPYLCAKVKVDNQGNVHVRPKGVVEITDRKGNQVSMINLIYGQPVYPGSERIYIGKLEDGLLQTGKYIARARISFDNTSEILEKKIFFKIDKLGRPIKGKAGDIHDQVEGKKDNIGN